MIRLGSSAIVGLLIILALGLFVFSLVKRLIRLAFFLLLVGALLYAVNTGLIPLPS